MRIISLMGLFATTLLSVAAAQTSTQLNLMPMPANVQVGAGQLAITQSFSVAVSGVRDAALDQEVRRFQADLSRQIGMSFYPQAGAAATLQVHAERPREAVQKLGEEESYELSVTNSGASLSAPNPLGIIRGLQTVLQLVRITSTGFAIPVVTIKDQPRFPWRGLMIDVSRHFFGVDVIERNLDAMAAVKMNVFHWHLSDDQGFRVESKKFPKLQEMCSDGLYYTQDEVREVIAYAHQRGIRVVPEFDMPGHTTAGDDEAVSGSVFPHWRR
jgi:hexosaminidase